MVPVGALTDEAASGAKMLIQSRCASGSLESTGGSSFSGMKSSLSPLLGGLGTDVSRSLGERNSPVW